MRRLDSSDGFTVAVTAHFSRASDTKLAHPTPWWVLGFHWDGLEQSRGRARGRVTEHLGYYEVYGAGEPLLLVHGNGSSIGSFKAQIDHFRKRYKVIAMDSRDQGTWEALKASLE